MPSHTDCPICASQAAGAPELSLVIYEDEHWRVRHSSETNLLGYLILESRRHFLDLAAATVEEANSYGPLLAAVMKAIRATIDCRRLYTFSLAEAVPHYHLHVIPVTQAMPKAYRGRGIMSYPLKPAADAALVEETCSRLKRAIGIACKRL